LPCEREANKHFNKQKSGYPLDNRFFYFPSLEIHAKFALMRLQFHFEFLSPHSYLPVIKIEALCSKNNSSEDITEWKKAK